MKIVSLVNLSPDAQNILKKMKFVCILGLVFLIQMDILQSNCKKIDKKQNKRLDVIEVNYRQFFFTITPS